MTHSISKQAFLDDLLARNAANLEQVQTTLAPLEPAARGAQPAPGEWGVDQCIRHLVLAYDFHMGKCRPVLARAAGRGTGDHFERSWMARRNFYAWQFSPATKISTMRRTNPPEQLYPAAYEQFAAQKADFAAAVERARSADLQTRAWFLWVTPINLGDYLEMLLRHDELHIGQAQRALAAYRQLAGT